MLYAKISTGRVLYIITVKFCLLFYQCVLFVIYYMLYAKLSTSKVYLHAKLVHSMQGHKSRPAAAVPLLTGLQDERKGMVLKWYLNSQTVPIYQQTVHLMTGCRMSGREWC